MFLETLEQVTPWKKLEAKVSRYYAKIRDSGIEKNVNKLYLLAGFAQPHARTEVLVSFM